MTELCVAFLDMSGFTALTETHGDRSAAQLAVDFVDLTKSLLATGDVLVKSLGDAVLITSHTVAGALALLRRIIDATHRRAFPLLSAGVAYGPIVAVAGDVYGVTVNVATRLAALAAPGQTLASGPVSTAARLADLRVTRLGPTALRNIAEPIEVFGIDLDDDCHCGHVDPVCRMRLLPGAAATIRLHEGRRYRLSSEGCLERFDMRPDRYVGTTP